MGEISTFKYKTCKTWSTNHNGTPNQRWECEWNGMFYNKGDTDDIAFVKLNDRISFNLSGNIMWLPIRIFDNFVHDYFGESLGKECNLKTNSWFTRVECLGSIDIRRFGAVGYVLGKWSIKWTPEDLFEHNHIYYDFKFRKHKDLNIFNLASQFFRRYTTVFDKVKGEIGVFKNRKDE